jgi:hypothetical protein
MEQLINETEEIMMVQKQRAKNKSNDMINIPNALPTDPLNNNNSLINGESTVEQEIIKIEDEQEKDQLGEDEDDNGTDGSNLDGGKPTCMKSDMYALQNINRQKQQELDALKKTLKNYKREAQDMEKVIDVLNQRNFLFAQQLDAKDNTISSPQFLNQLYDKDNEIQFLKQELQTLQAERTQEQQESQEKMDTLNELLRSKRIEIKLLKQNIELTLFKEKYHKRKLESENKRLKIEMKEYDVLIQTANGHRSESDTEFDSYENDILTSNKVVDALKINQNGTAVCTIGNKKRRVSSPDSEC